MSSLQFDQEAKAAIREAIMHREEVQGDQTPMFELMYAQTVMLQSLVEQLMLLVTAVVSLDDTFTMHFNRD